MEIDRKKDNGLRLIRISHALALLRGLVPQEKLDVAVDAVRRFQSDEAEELLRGLLEIASTENT